MLQTLCDIHRVKRYLRLMNRSLYTQMRQDRHRKVKEEGMREEGCSSTVSVKATGTTAPSLAKKRDSGQLSSTDKIENSATCTSTSTSPSISVPDRSNSQNAPEDVQTTTSKSPKRVKFSLPPSAEETSTQSGTFVFPHGDHSSAATKSPSSDLCSSESNSTPAGSAEINANEPLVFSSSSPPEAVVFPSSSSTHSFTKTTPATQPSFAETTAPSVRDEQEHHGETQRDPYEEPFQGLIDLRTGEPVVSLDTKCVPDSSWQANQTMLRPFVQFFKETSLFSRWLRQRFYLPTNGNTSTSSTHTLYNNGRVRLEDTRKGVRRAFVNMYAAAISRPFAQIFVNERTEGSPGIARVFFDFDFKGPPVSVPEICKVARYVQEVVGEYMNFESFSSSKETRRLIGTVIILGTKQFPTEAQTFVAKDGTRVVNPSKQSKTAGGEEHGNDWDHQNEVEGSGQEHPTQNEVQEGKSHEDNRNQSGASSSTTADTDSVPYKSGFHIIFPFVYATPAQRKQLNVNVASVLNRCVPCHQFKEDWSKIVDPRVTDHLRMLGSRRLQGCPLECGKKPPSKLPRKQTKTRGPSSTVGDTDGSEDFAEDNKEILDVNEDTKVRPFVHLSTAPSSSSPLTDSISHGMKSSSPPAGSASSSSTETYRCFTPLSTSSIGSGDRDSLRKKSDRPKRKRVCPFCEGQEECIEDRSYVPLCVVDGHGDRDPKFELSLLDLRQAVDWTMIRAPSLWYNPDAGEIQPRTDVDESVIWDQLYGLYRDMKQTLDEDIQTQTSETESRLTDAYQFILKKKKLSQVDLRYLYHYTFLRLPSPRDMFGDDIRTTKIPQWKGWATYSSRPSFSTVSTPFTNVDEWDEFSFVDVDFHRYPEALDMESSPPSNNGKRKVRLSISEYDLERLPQDVRNDHSKQKAHQDEHEISHSDPRCERLMSVIRRIHQNYHQVLPRKVTYQPAVCTYLVQVKGAGSQYCMHREGNHKKNHVLFQISVNANPREPHLKAFQRCYDDECNKGFQNGQVRSAKKNAIIFTRDIQSHLSVLRPDLDDTEIHNIMHHGTRSLSPSPLSSRRDGNGNKGEDTQANRETTAHSKQAPSYSLFPPPPSHRSTPFLPDATAPPVSFDAHLKEKKMKAAKVRLERLWHQLGTRHRQICNCGKESDRLLRLSQSVLKTWWESVLRKKKKKKSDSLPPSSGPPESNETSSSPSHNQISDWWRKQMDSRSVIPDNILEIIDSLFLAEYLYTREEFLNEIKDLPARLKGTFREYLNLLCFWFGTQASYKSVLLSNKASNNDDEGRKDGKNDKGRRAASLGNPSHVVSVLPGSLDDVLNNYCNLLLPHVGRKKTTKGEETPSASTPESGTGAASPSPENSHS